MIDPQPAKSVREWHVSTSGSDDHPGTESQPLLTVSAAAALAQPGDTVTVHGGVYREQVDPPRGGESEDRRITYQAAPGETVTLLGSENVRGWQPVASDIWKVKLPNTFFGDFNPYAETIRGDWFTRVDREHHRGAVYLDGEWLWEAHSLDAVFRRPDPVIDQTDFQPSGEPIFKLHYLEIGEGNFVRMDDCKACEGPELFKREMRTTELVNIRDGHWATFPQVDFAAGRDFLRVCANVLVGGYIDLHVDGLDGGAVACLPVGTTEKREITSTFEVPMAKKVTGVHDVYLRFREAPVPPSPIQPPAEGRMWFAEVTGDDTTIWAQFGRVDPNAGGIEINVRPTVFYPSLPGIDYLTVRGFEMRNAATNWAPPTAEQPGLIGTHWSRGWIIENNVISHSACAGITLGKYGDAFDNATSQPAPGLSADYLNGTWAFNRTVERAAVNGWDRVGHHTVRNNCILHCGQGGIIGSLGGVFSTITGNHIHHIHYQRLYKGYEQAGIKLHGSVDCTIAHNHIHHCALYGIWLDWLTQGTLLCGNLLHHHPDADILFEVNHGPFIFANNICLSTTAIRNWSSGGAFVHNLIGGRVRRSGDGRETPVLKPHSVEVTGLHPIPNGDVRWYNNVFLTEVDMAPLNEHYLDSVADGNVHGHAAQHTDHEDHAVVMDSPPQWRLREESDGWFLDLEMSPAALASVPRKAVSSALLGEAVIAGQAFAQPDGTPFRMDRDYFGNARESGDPVAGPFDLSGGKTFSISPFPDRFPYTISSLFQ